MTNPTTVHITCIHATLRLGESTPESIAAECGLDVELTRNALLLLSREGYAKWDDSRKGYVPAGTARSLPMSRVVAL